jgi:hypothetical protein
MPAENKAHFPILILALAVATDLISPWLIMRGSMPASLRWISHGIIALLIFWAILRMLAFRQFPGIIGLITFVSLAGIANSILRGQSLTITVWGWWLFFQFPIVGIFTYLQPGWPGKFSRWLTWTCVFLLAVESLFQVYQYLRGYVPGDQLGGTFGRNGTGNLYLFVLLVLCLGLGEWLAHRDSRPLFIAMICGMVSSTLGEMKIFLPVTLVLSCLALGIYILQAKNLWKAIPFSFLVGIIFILFLTLYNTVIPAARQQSLQSFISDTSSVVGYLNASTRFVEGQNTYTDIGRNYALVYGWKQISQDPITLVFGFGLGARSESSSLGIAGQGLSQGELGLSTGTSLLVLMQEQGVSGLAILIGFFVFIIVSLYREIRRQPASNANGLRYGLILFSMLWPLLLWYNTAWVARVAMLFYWGSLGYVMNPSVIKGQLQCQETAHLQLPNLTSSGSIQAG